MITASNPRSAVWSLSDVQERWGACLDEIQHAARVVPITRLGRLSLACANPTRYAAWLTDRSAALRRRPYALVAGPNSRLPDWSAVPANARRLVVDSRIAQPAWAEIHKRVVQQHLHVIVRRYGVDAAVFVPADVADEIRSAALPSPVAAPPPPARSRRRRRAHRR